MEISISLAISYEELPSLFADGIPKYETALVAAYSFAFA
jgi:hypothetical protein